MHPKRALSEEGYLTLERAAESKSEFLDGEMVAMAGAKAPHNALAFNFTGSLFARLPESCRGYNSDMKVRAGEGHFNFYPDVVVV